MKNYVEMSQEEITRIVNKGGDNKTKLDSLVCDHLNYLELSDEAREVIADTDLGSMAEIFGGLFTAKEVEEFITDNY